MSELDVMRYRFFRVHKYITQRMFNLEGLIAKTDFTHAQQTLLVKQQLTDFESLMKMHAVYEDNAILLLLKQKGSLLHSPIEAEHKHHEADFVHLQDFINQILALNEPAKQITLGFQFYIAYRTFISEMLQHLNQEETIVMAELQKLYTDDELKSVERGSYNQMTPEQMIHMLEQILPYMDHHDKLSFLSGIEEAEPEKYKQVSQHFTVA